MPVRLVDAGSESTAPEIGAEIDAKGSKAVINRLATANVYAMGRSGSSRTMDRYGTSRLVSTILKARLRRTRRPRGLSG